MMNEELSRLLKSIKPKINPGDYVFCVVKDLSSINIEDITCFFKEEEGVTLILKREIADKLQLDYSFIAAWITLTVHSSLEAVGLTAAFSNALSAADISCNVVAAYYHDHIFVKKEDATEAMNVLNNLSLF
ncbi:hypothetical protein M2459_000047 [Parabacteroides sp. PF5-5]|uniref:ACT domain-containing protein n=1 Tax=unclassified Parabacteroides TaxID=2649774 RepID=UPI002474230C|nr:MULTISPECIES: ACT domain-containing protein [unclassified Parabacteroides]MDH6303715.1 hypothetical protein [Parabacteroides sp. PH5-39]MDH6314332.1 hypothetical protein [Parabacteroides sp. PF5-13]MDH6318604.1 hypothetical protein [Parabacteroides sp. PH5-13]MDH6322104.1 hypothetical protein [Parabacteroides sp. PH5-8]MDH6325817.1 hypothetical protein [Parabacteroides sp. PH5-41]